MTVGHPAGGSGRQPDAKAGRAALAVEGGTPSHGVPDRDDGQTKPGAARDPTIQAVDCAHLPDAGGVRSPPLRLVRVTGRRPPECLIPRARLLGVVMGMRKSDSPVSILVVIGVEVSEHLAVDGYWSMVETRHHLVFVQNSWFRGCVLGRNEPFTGLAAARGWWRSPLEVSA